MRGVGTVAKNRCRRKAGSLIPGDGKGDSHILAIVGIVDRNWSEERLLKKTEPGPDQKFACGWPTEWAVSRSTVSFPEPRKPPFLPKIGTRTCFTQGTLW
jgi:hypothetical protein